MEEILTLLREYGLWFVFFGMIVEGSTVIILSGVLCHMGVLPCEETLFVAILGAIAGDQIWFFIGRNYAQKVLSRFPKIQLQVRKIETKVKAKANLLASTSRFVYGGAVVFPLALGMHGYKHGRFTLFDSLGVSLASMAGLALGYFVSNSYHAVLEEVGRAEHLLLFILLLAAGIKWYQMRKKQSEDV